MRMLILLPVILTEARVELSEKMNEIKKVLIRCGLPWIWLEATRAARYEYIPSSTH